MTSLKDLKLYTTAEHDCSYLPEQKAKTLFIDPEFNIDSEFHTRLNEIGFRRSGSHLYRPNCETCQECIPCRVLVDQFTTNKRYKRVLSKNKDLKVSQVSTIASEEYFKLYEKYIDSRHNDGDMHPATWEQYLSFLVARHKDTLYLEIRLDERLVGLMVCDQLLNGLSAVFTFYDPELKSRSLGTFAILWQIKSSAQMKLPYLYLGYWINKCDKMNYKTQFKPVELLLPEGWTKQ